MRIAMRHSQIAARRGDHAMQRIILRVARWAGLILISRDENDLLRAITYYSKCVIEKRRHPSGYDVYDLKEVDLDPLQGSSD